MDREKKIFLCISSLINISQDLKEDYFDFSNMILFIADKIVEHEQKKEENVYQLHGDGKVHNLGSGIEVKYDDKCTCGEGEACNFCATEDDKIDQEIDEMIQTVKKEITDVSDKQ